MQKIITFLQALVDFIWRAAVTLAHWYFLLQKIFSYSHKINHSLCLNGSTFSSLPKSHYTLVLCLVSVVYKKNLPVYFEGYKMITGAFILSKLTILIWSLFKFFSAVRVAFPSNNWIILAESPIFHSSAFTFLSECLFFHIVYKMLISYKIPSRCNSRSWFI